MAIAWDVLNSPETPFELAGGEFHFGFGAVDQGAILPACRLHAHGLKAALASTSLFGSLLRLEREALAA